MFLGRCNNVILLDSFQGISKNISILFDFDRTANRSHKTCLLSVGILGANFWRVCPAFHKIFALRLEKGKTLHTAAFQRLFNKCGTDTGLLRKGVRWSLVRGNDTAYKFHSLSVTALSRSGSGRILSLILGTLGVNTPWMGCQFNTGTMNIHSHLQGHFFSSLLVCFGR